MKPLVFLELNEVNFDYIQFYIREGYLQNFKYCFDKYGYIETTSEAIYENIEPWIQWVSARTGKSFKDHGVFRLGDISQSDVKQHWEVLEENGISVAAVSPINGANRTMKSPFWIPDPWVDTVVSGGATLENISAALRQAVNDNASDRLTNRTKLSLLVSFLSFSRLSSFGCYLKNAIGVIKGYHWSKAIILDRLLGDIYFKLYRKHRPAFSTLFLNSAAHIQHHYMYNSKAYDGALENPSWYINKTSDPVLDIYVLYDQILGDALKLDARVVVATGLKQIPYEKLTYYYRLTDHESFLKSVGIEFSAVLTRMSRDFVIEFDCEKGCKVAGDKLASLDVNGDKLFDVDNRGRSLFVTLVYGGEILDETQVYDCDDVAIDNLKKAVDFVAIKNGHHHHSGFLLDTGIEVGQGQPSVKINQLFQRVLDHFSISN